MEQKLWFLTDACEDAPQAVKLLQDSSELALYWFLKLSGGSTRQDIYRFSGLTERTAERKMKRLQDAGIIHAK